MVTRSGQAPARLQPAPPASADLPNPDAVRQLASGLGLALPDRATHQLVSYLGLLQRWNSVYNLTALRDAERIGSHHLADCLAVLPALQRAAGDRRWRVMDVGSGGGLPGVVLAIARPDWTVCCVDTVAKKASFIRQVAAELALPNLQAQHARVERLAIAQPPTARPGGAEVLAPFDLIIARAFASLADFTGWTRHALAHHGQWVAMKGRHPQDELAELPPSVAVFHVEQLQVPGLEAERCLVWMRSHTGVPASA